MRVRIRHWVFAGLLVGWITLGSTFAQPSGKTAQTSPSNPASDSASDQNQGFNFAVQVQVVTVPVTVTDSKGNYVTNLDKRDFTIYDDGHPQNIEHFELTSQPLSLAIVVENSSRVETLLPDVRASGILITQLILGESGEAAVLSFDRDVKIVQNFTRDSDKIEAALRKLQPGNSQDHLSDAIARAIFLLQRRPSGRRKIIVAISEARDAGSKYNLGLVLRSAQQLGIPVYTVGLSMAKALFSTPPGQNAPSSPYPPGVIVRPSPGMMPPTPDVQSNYGAANVNMLEIISDLVTYTKSLVRGNPLSIYATGTGAKDFPASSKGKIENALGKIGEELRNQYILTYRPSDMGKFGFHSIQVVVARRGVRTRYRPGYVLAPPALGAGSSPTHHTGAPAGSPAAGSSSPAPKSASTRQ